MDMEVDEEEEGELPPVDPMLVDPEEACGDYRREGRKKVCNRPHKVWPVVPVESGCDSREKILEEAKHDLAKLHQTRKITTYWWDSFFEEFGDVASLIRTQLNVLKHPARKWSGSQMQMGGRVVEGRGYSSEQKMMRVLREERE
jgi:hypothetical protein